MGILELYGIGDRYRLSYVLRLPFQELKETSQTEDRGAPAALRVIAEQEAEARKDHSAAKTALDDAISNQLLNPDDELANKKVENARSHLDDCEKRWHRWLKHLREFDKSVSEDKRDAEESITRTEGKKYFFHAAIAMRQAMENTISRLYTDLLGCKTEQEMHKISYRDFNESMFNAVKAALVENHLPIWAKEAIEEVI